MTAPISNEPTTTRLHHYAGRYFCVRDAVFQRATPRMLGAFEALCRLWCLMCGPLGGGTVIAAAGTTWTAAPGG